MAITKRIVCLANSRKLNGRCVAGKELINGTPAGWIRPVSDREHEEVSEYERQYEDGSDPSVLDVINMSLLDPRPKRYQQENWLLDPDCYWEKVGRATWDELLRLLDPTGPLWIDGHSTYHGRNDQIPLLLAHDLTTSLLLIRVDAVVLSVFSPGQAFGNPKRRVQARFLHSGVEYRLRVTDPIYERRYLAMPDGDHQLGECILTISLGEPFNNACYKLVAAVIERPQESSTT
jgi:Dual OB-containing domain